MSVVTRLGGWVLAAGLLAGVILRLSLGRGRFAAVLSWALVVPWALHAGYVTVQALSHGFSLWWVVAFLAAGAALAAGATLLGRRLAAERGLLAALAPVALGLVYGLGPFLLMSLALRRAGIDVDVVPTAAYAAACLFGAGALLPFAPRRLLPGPASGRRMGPWRRR